MIRKVQQKYLPEERNMFRNFDKAWMEAESYYKKKTYDPLNKMEAMAAHVYVNPLHKVYEPFNRATSLARQSTRLGTSTTPFTSSSPDRKSTRLNSSHL